MRSSHTDYLDRLEAIAATRRADDMYLWPWTPRGPDHQREIAARVGAADRDAANPRSRPVRIIRQIRRLRRLGLIPQQFVVCDLMCGDALVLGEVKQAFPDARCVGLDCARGTFATHPAVERLGVELRQAYIQDVFATEPAERFDVVLMLNTYRDWESAQLRPGERDLPRLAGIWLHRHARYLFVTATQGQIASLGRSGRDVVRLGRGEDYSELVCAGRPLPRSTRQWLRSAAHMLGVDSRLVFRVRRKLVSVAGGRGRDGVED